MILHAGLVALRLGGTWRGALLEGPSGAGKSDLALRALEDGFRLVADDRTLLWTSAGRLYGRAPDPLAGLIEARSVGVLANEWIAFAEIIVAVSCVDPSEPLERTPPPELGDVGGVGGAPVPRLRLKALEASALVKLRRALGHLGRPPQQAYLGAILGGGGRAGTGTAPLRPPR